MRGDTTKKTKRSGGEGRKPAGRDDKAAPAGERVAKRLARAGLASRREAEAMVEAGRVCVNGKTLDSPAFNVREGDRIEVDGRPLPAVERTRLFLFHKPAGVVTTNRDPQGRRTVFDVLPEGLPRLMTVGRLDINTEGLLVMTNDGGLARTLELPATGWLRRYRVRVHGKVDPEALEALKEGSAVNGVYYGAVEAVLEREQGSNAWLTISLREGKNREVKNILGALGLEVTRLIRVSYGPFQLGALAGGAVQEIKGRTLREQLGERLIAEAGANFEAPVAQPFTNKPVRAERPGPAAPASAERPAADKRKRRDKREEARDRLQTRPDAAPAGKGHHHRSAHVWMAPGARPQGRGKAGDEGAKDEGARGKARPGPDRPRGGAGKRPRKR